jgi:hypothetical protein
MNLPKTKPSRMKRFLKNMPLKKASKKILMKLIMLKILRRHLMKDEVI